MYLFESADVGAFADSFFLLQVFYHRRCFLGLINIYAIRLFVAFVVETKVILQNLESMVYTIGYSEFSMVS